jgi:hypothetical protein
MANKEEPYLIKHLIYPSRYEIFGPIEGIEQRLWDLVRKECPEATCPVLSDEEAYDGDFTISVLRPETERETERRLEREAKRKEQYKKQKILNAQKRIEEKMKKEEEDRKLYERLKKKYEGKLISLRNA